MNIVRTFALLKSRLFRIAYRILRSRADAEDIVQEAWLRWDDADHASMRSAEAWLVTVTTRLSIDCLRTRRNEHESCSDGWFPEPVVESDERTPEVVAELASDLQVALLWLLERLSVDERAAFLLRQVFDLDYDEIALNLGKSEAACRQLVSRAGERVREDQPRYEVSHCQHKELMTLFMEAASTGNHHAMKSMLVPDAKPVADGGKQRGNST